MSVAPRYTISAMYVFSRKLETCLSPDFVAPRSKLLTGALQLGHARNYVTTDVIRRILRDYFGFKLTFVGKCNSGFSGRSSPVLVLGADMTPPLRKRDGCRR